MWDEALKCPHLNPLPEGEEVFSAKLKTVCDYRPGRAFTPSVRHPEHKRGTSPKIAAHTRQFE